MARARREELSRLGERRRRDGLHHRPHHPLLRPLRLATVAALAAASFGWSSGVSAQGNPLGLAVEIYVCTDAQGRNHTSDRPIRACIDRPQRILNPDGSLRGVLQPPLTAQEAAEKEARDKREAERAAAFAEAARRERNLLLRYPDEDSHRSSRAASLEPTRLAMELTATRQAQLARERKTLNDELKALGNKPVPQELRTQLDANETAVTAQRVLSRAQQAEFDRITRAFDRELLILKRLWAGVKPGAAEAGLDARGAEPKPGNAKAPGS
jgi:hypothetical protein